MLMYQELETFFLEFGQGQIDSASDDLTKYQIVITDDIYIHNSYEDIQIHHHCLLLLLKTPLSKAP